VAISPQLPKHSREFREERRIAFEVLSDPGNATADAYGLTFTFPDELRALYEQFGIILPEYNGDDSWRLPMPARYVVGEDREIRYARVDADYTRRPEPDETVAFLRGLRD